MTTKLDKKRMMTRHDDPAVRLQVMNLLMPGFHMMASKRGAAATPEEIEVGIDIYIDGGMADGRLKQYLEELADKQLMPDRCVVESCDRRVAHLYKLKSVSPAYINSQIHPYLRKGNSYANRSSPQDPARSAVQTPGSGGPGGAQAGGGNGGIFTINTTSGGSGAAGSGPVPGNFFDPRNPPPNAGQWGQWGIAHQTQQLALLANVGIAPPALPVGGYGGLAIYRAAKADTPSLPVEIKPGEITAYRCWYRYTDEPEKLYSMHSAQTWRIGFPIVAQIEPDPGGSIGVHAWKGRDQAIQYAHQHEFGPPPSLRTPSDDDAFLEVVVGQVEMWGKVIEHQDGYRAQFAEAKAIDYTFPVKTRQGHLIKLSRDHPPSPWFGPGNELTDLWIFGGFLTVVGTLIYAIIRAYVGLLH